MRPGSPDIPQVNESPYTVDLVPALVWMTGEDKLCTFLNRAWLDYTGMALQQPLQGVWLDRIHSEDRLGFWDLYSTAFDRREKFRYECRILGADGVYRWFSGEAVPHVAPNGIFLGYVGCCLDLGESRRIQQAIKESQDQLVGIIASAMDAIITVDENQRITMFNAAAEKIFRCPAEGALGHSLDRFIPERFRSAHREHIRFFGQTNVTRRHMGMLGAISGLRADGEEFPIEASISQFQVAGQKHFTVILRDITARTLDEQERERLLEREKEGRQMAEAANRLKDEFLATLSHELRTPLNAILGWAHLLRSGHFDEGTAASGLEAIERNARAQSQLIEDLLDLSRIIMGKIRLDVRVVDLRSIIEAAVETVHPAAWAKGIQVKTTLNAATGPVSWDPNRLQQVLWNLLSNAVKFTSKGGCVEVRLERTNSTARITVSDTGEGIAADVLPHVFDRFSQGNSSRKHGGLGLGLAIVRHLVELHGGTIWAESPGEGQGATFTLELPVRSDPSHLSSPKGFV